MGVPSFYAWVKKRYPLMVQHVHHTCSDSLDGQAGAGPVDNLYIDMNGIIHPCFHPENGEPPATEQECFEAILAYIDALLYIVRPRRMLYLAVDGPAPQQGQSARLGSARGRPPRLRRARLAAPGSSRHPGRAAGPLGAQAPP